MAKKKIPKKKMKPAQISENVLPQNIIPIGDRVEENKNIYISQPVYKEIHKFTQNKTINESGGMLIGEVVEEFGKTNIICLAKIIVTFVFYFINYYHLKGPPFLSLILIPKRSTIIRVNTIFF